MPVFHYNIRSLPKGSLLLFAPAVFFVILAMLTLFSPKVTVLLISSILMFFGLMLGIAAWKIIQLKRRFENMVQSMTGNVFIQAVRMPEESQLRDMIAEDKKFFLH